jgi:hypothetical protein
MQAASATHASVTATTTYVSGSRTGTSNTSDAEDCAVGADAERDGEHDRKREQRRLPQHAIVYRRSLNSSMGARSRDIMTPPLA